MDQLLKVRQGTVNLKNKIIDLNYDVQNSGKKVASKVNYILKFASDLTFLTNIFFLFIRKKSLYKHEEFKKILMKLLKHYNYVYMFSIWRIV